MRRPDRQEGTTWRTTRPSGRAAAIATHHQRRSDRSLYAVDVACLDGVSPFDVPQVPVMDGINHTGDTGTPTRRAGTLRFVPVDD